MAVDGIDVTREVADLVAKLRVEPVGGDRYVGHTCEVGSPNVYGGQFVGQALMAAGLTAPDRPVHSMHAYFLRPGDKAAPVVYGVERTFDGASFSKRRVVATQDERVLFEAIVSLQVVEAGHEHQRTLPAVTPADELPNESASGSRTSLWPIEVRWVTTPSSPPGPRAAWWLRAAAALPDDPLLHQAMLAYASDYSLLQAAMRVFDLRFQQPGLQLASLDHALWFHRAPRFDSWLLFDTESPSTSGARAFVRGDIFEATGRLVMSVAQEGLMRLRA